MTKIFRNALPILFLLTFQLTYAWGTVGHRVIAEIAQNNLTNKSKKQLKKILGEEKLAYWANWPDFIKSDTTGVWKETEAWHYINVEPQPDYEAFKKALIAEAGPNIYTQIKVLSAQIKDKKTLPLNKHIALRFLVHLMGDAAQPLHVGRHEDLGGNKIKLKYFGDASNLHALWDSKMVEMQKYSYTEYAAVLDVKSNSEKKIIQSGTLEDWLFDTHEAANTIYSSSVAGNNYSYDYNYQFEALLERQLLYGGLRLAKLLNDIL